jgi:methanethiol S-methyltransferase
MQYIVLASLWFSWCFFHSALISMPVMKHLRAYCGPAFRWQRLAYNGFAVLALLPVLTYAHAIRSEPFFAWHGSWRLVQVLLICAAVGLFTAGAKQYDARQFIGLRQLAGEDYCSVLSKTCTLDRTGILGMIRHPWYVGGMLIVWARDLDLSVLISNFIITGYFIVGAVLEERKLSLEFGDFYKDYQRSVSMFFPYRWLKSRLKLF